MPSSKPPQAWWGGRAALILILGIGLLGAGIRVAIGAGRPGLAG